MTIHSAPAPTTCEGPNGAALGGPGAAPGRHDGRWGHVPHARGLTPAVIVTIVIAGVISALIAPGRFAPDSLDIYNQARHHVYNDWHTPILAGVWGVFQLPPELVLLLFVTMVMVAAVLLLATEVPVGWAVVAVTLVCVWPMTFGVLTTVGKDAWFAGFFLAGAAASAYAVRASGRWRSIVIGVTGACFWLAVAARPNAIVPVAAVLVLGWPLATNGGRARWLSRQGAKRVGVAFLLALGLLVSQRVYSAVVVRPIHAHPEQPSYQFDLAALSLRTGTMLLPASSLKPGATLDDLRRWYDEGEGTYLFFPPEAPIQFRVDAKAVAELRSAWLKAIREHPLEFIEHRLRYTTDLLGIDRPTYTVYDFPADPQAWGFDYRLHAPFFPSFTSWIEGTVATLGWYGKFRAWIWVVVLLAVGLSPRGRASVAVRSIATAGLAALLSFVLAGTSAGFRYAWFTMLCALLLLPFALTWLIGWARRGHRARTGTRPPAADDGTLDAAEPLAEPVDASPMIRRSPA